VGTFWRHSVGNKRVDREDQFNEC